jgi:fructose-bisphosphate aldolase, class II
LSSGFLKVSAISWVTNRFPRWVASFGDEDGIPLYLNADHTHTLEGAIATAKAGFDSIVFDLLPIEENIRQTKEAIEVLKGINPSILIEGEIGDICTGSNIREMTPDLSWE